MNTFRTLRWGSTREAKLLVYRQHGGKDTLANLLTLCEACHHKVHRGELTLKATGVSGHLDVIAQRTMQGKAYLYAALGKLARLTTVYGYQTSAYRKARGLPKTHLVDALCIATLHTGKAVSEQRECDIRYMKNSRASARVTWCG